MKLKEVQENACKEFEDIFGKFVDNNLNQVGMMDAMKAKINEIVKHAIEVAFYETAVTEIPELNQVSSGRYVATKLSVRSKKYNKIVRECNDSKLYFLN